jgi:2-hydroxy-6-oxonona-2,4-dienedioate hydrolase
MKAPPLILSDNDPKVIEARNAEKELFDFYDLQAKEHYVLLPGQGIRVRVLEIGEGEPLVIVPGNTGDVFPLASSLAELKGRRIIAINRPGGGLSEGMDHNTVEIRSFVVQTLETVFNHFNLENADVVAHSMGAHWSFWLATDRPKLVRSLSLLGNPGNVMKGKPPFLMMLLIKSPFSKLFLTLLMPSDKSKALNSLKIMGHSKETLANLPKELGDSYYYFRLLPHYIISFISLMQNKAPNIDAQQLSQVKQPSQLLLGDKDTFASVAVGESIVAAMPNCKLYVIKGAGHLPWLESPEECGDIIKSFHAKNSPKVI